MKRHPLILTDGVHLISDESIKELHEFAQSMGLKRCWYRRGRHPHYDLTTSRKVQAAMTKGAKMVTSKDLVRASLKALGGKQDEKE